MNDTLISRLQQSGLSENEARIYVALVTGGSLSVSQIAENADVNRASAYPILEALEAKGLVKRNVHISGALYGANSLTRYKEYMRSNVDRYRRLRREVEDSVPSLRKQYTSSKIRPRITYFEGKSGMKQAFGLTLHSREKLMRVISNVENIFASFPGYLPQYIYLRAIKGIEMRGIHPNTVLTRTVRAMPQATNDRITMLDRNEYSFDVDIAIWDEHVSYMSHEKLYAISVQSPAFSQTMKQVYDLAWNNSNRVEKKPKA